MNKSTRRIFIWALFVYVFILASPQIGDPDFWWHLKAGEYIVSNGVIPHTDFFSFTNVGREWVAHEWLSEVIFSVVYSALGFRGLIVVFAIITTAALWIAFKRFDAHPLIGGFAVLLGMWTSLPTIGVRPRVITLLFTSIYLATLGRYARRGEGRAIWWLVPLMVLWVNLHGGFLIGLVIIVLTIIGIVLDALAMGEPLHALWPRIRALSLVLLACLAVVVLNPNGLRIYTFPFEIFFSPVQQDRVLDWLSPNFHEPDALPLAALILMTIAALSLSPKRARPSDLLLFLATLYATLKSGRHLAIFLLVAIPILAEHLQSWIVSTSWGKPFRETNIAGTRREARIFALCLLAPILAYGVNIKKVFYDSPTQGAPLIPVKAIEVIKERHLSGNIFNVDSWGGYLIWTLPANPVFIDGRIDMYGDEFVKEYINITGGIIDWRKSFDRYNVRIALVKSKTMLGRELQDSPDWEKVYEDDMAVVFTRR